MANEKSIFLSEEEKRQIVLNRSYSERFHLLMGLIRINKMLKSATIISSSSGDSTTDKSDSKK